MKYIAIIPAYEPDHRLLPLLKEVKNAQFDAIVVDDGSGEKYNEIFEEAASYAEVLRYLPNHGKGYAMKQAFSLLVERGISDAVIITLDSDGQHTVNDALRLCSYVEEHPEELVLGSRKRDENVPLRSRFGNGITRFVFRVVTRCDVYDTQTGLRAFSFQLLPRLLEVQGDRYEYEMNMLMDFTRQKIKITELPIEVIYFDENKGSHFNPWKDSARIYKAIFRFLGGSTVLKFTLSSLVAFLIDFAIYSVLNWLFGFSILHNVIARVVSATVNFLINRALVFQYKKKEVLWKSALKYYALAAGILVANSFLLYCLVDLLSWNSSISKLLVEVVLYIASFLVQKSFVYYRKK